MTDPKAYNAIDHLRCALIVMVVLIHIVNFGELYPYTKACINAFFMPAFLFITGYLTNIDKPPRAFARYLGQIALPYTLLVTGYALLSLHLPVRDGLAELTPRALGRVLLVTSIGPYWFLHTMMLCALFYYAAFRLPDRWGRAARLCLFATLLIGVALITPLLVPCNAAFYFAGACLRLFHGSFSSFFRPTAWALLPFAALAAHPACLRQGALTAAVLTAAFFCFLPALTGRLRGPWARTVGYVGRNTFPIYLFHPLFTLAAKFYLPLFRPDPSGLLHTLVTVLLGLLGSLAIAWTMDRLRLTWVFGRARMLR